LKGDAKEEELLAELDRDCVDVVLEMPMADRAIVWMCESLVNALVEWPLLTRSMENVSKGGYCDWTCSQSFFYMTLPPKIYSRNQPIGQRPLKDMSMYLSMKLTEMEEYNHEWCDSKIEEFVQNIKLDRIHKGGRDIFWFVNYDWGSCTVNKMSSSAKRIYKTIRATTNDAIISMVHRLNDTIPNVEVILHPTPLKSIEQKVFEHLLSNKGFDIHWNAKNIRENIKPITFPTAWHISRYQYQSVMFIIKKC
jgi:hypothetical protein